jgi:hypothetical protein
VVVGEGSCASNEALAPTSNGGAVPVGNGNGIKAFGGTFSLVVSP